MRLLIAVLGFAIFALVNTLPAAEEIENKPSVAADEISVLVKTQSLKRRILPITLTAYGVVGLDTENTVNISFPRAGQVSRLLVSLGQVVKSGAPLLQLTTDPTANLSYNEAVSAVELARGEVKRITSLLTQQLATQSQLATAKKALADAEAALQAQQNVGAGLKAETITAPFDGIVSTLSVAQGDRIQAGAIALQLARQDALRVQLGVEPEDRGLISIGLPVHLTSVFDTRWPVEATLSEVHGMIDPQTQLIDVSVRLTGKQSEHLIPGMRVRGVITSSQQESWVVPQSAVLRDTEGAYIFQVDRNHRARRVAVQIGVGSGGLIGVSGTFDPNKKIVALGNYELQDGMMVREDTK